MRRKPRKVDDTSPALMNLRAEVLALEVDASELEKKALAHHAASGDLLAHVRRHVKRARALVAEMQPEQPVQPAAGVDDVAGGSLDR